MKIRITKKQADYLLMAIEYYSNDIHPPDEEEAEIISSLININNDYNHLEGEPNR
jgi:hypothetical protein